jgi:hypothetical protein
MSLISEKLILELKALKAFVRNKKIRNLIGRAKFIGDGIITRFDIFLTNPKLIKSFNDSFDYIPKKYESLRDLVPRFQILIWAMNFTKKINGGVVECGVWYGVLTRALLNYFESIDDRTFYLFDSWGQPEFKLNGFYKQRNYLKDIFDVVKLRFPDRKVRLIRGILPDSLDNELPEKISLLMIDLNSGIVEVQVLNKCWSRIPKGGIVYFDDYNSDFPRITSSIDKFVEKFDQDLLIFPSGQALIVKN